MNLPASAGLPSRAEESDRLDSWKEIASYLNRGVTTVQRWEREEGLPVHRQQHDSLGSVYAYKHEIEEWRAKRTLSGDGDRGSVLEAPVAIAAPARRRPITLSMPIFAAALLTAVVVGVGGGRLWRSDEPRRVSRLTIVPPTGAPLVTNGTLRNIAITPDGSRIVYVGGPGASRIFVRPIDQTEVTAIAGVGSPRHPFISPDGNWIGFFDGSTALKKVPISGGPTTMIAATSPYGPTAGETSAGSNESGPRGATWGTDNRIIFASMGNLMRVSADGGKPELLASPDRKKREAAFYWPELVLGYNILLFTIIPSGDWSEKGSSGSIENAQIAALDLRTGARKVLLEGGSHARYVDSGHLVFAAAGTLKAVPFNVGALDVIGRPQSVIEQVRMTVRGAADFDVSRDGTLVYSPGDLANDLVTLLWVDRQGREVESIGTPPFVYRYPRISPDGRQLTVGSSRDLGVWDFSKRTLSWFGVGPASYPVWTPDGRRLIFASTRGAAAKLYALGVDGKQPMTALTTDFHGQSPNAISPEGTHLVFREEGESSSDLMVLDLGGGQSRAKPLVQTPFSELNADFSPDGRFITYQSNESGQQEVYVQPFPNTTGQRWIVSHGGGSRPAWSRTGQELFYIAPSGAMTSVTLNINGASFSATEPVKLFDRPFFLGGGVVAGRTYDVSPDGQRFLMMKPVNAPSPGSRNNIEVVLNWFDELKRALPQDEKR